MKSNVFAGELTVKGSFGKKGNAYQDRGKKGISVDPIS
jgi:hypothetical protein